MSPLTAQNPGWRPGRALRAGGGGGPAEQPRPRPPLGTCVQCSLQRACWQEGLEPQVSWRGNCWQGGWGCQHWCRDGGGPPHPASCTLCGAQTCPVWVVTLVLYMGVSGDEPLPPPQRNNAALPPVCVNSCDQCNYNVSLMTFRGKSGGKGWPPLCRSVKGTPVSTTGGAVLDGGAG